MATIGRTNGASFTNTPRLQYISTAPFNTYFYSYSTSLNASLQTIGTLSVVSGATAFTCPQGRVLRENGRKLYPDANPGITTYLVGVYDAQSMLSGFIDPNARVFQIYNTDKPNFLADGVEPSGSATDLGPSVYTAGDLLAEGNLDLSGYANIYGSATIHDGATIYSTLGVYNGAVINSGDLTVTLGTIIAGKQIRSSTVTALPTGSTFVINCSLGQVFTLTTNANATVTASNLAAGAVVYIVVQGDAGGRTIDFNTQFRTLNAGVRTINASLCTFSFVSDGTALYQIGEAIGLSA
jgi:hypothetical protein